MVGAGLSAPTQSSAGIAANAAAPAASYVIGQEFKRRNAEGSLGHLLAHATLGGLTAAAGGNDPLAGALSSGGAEAAAGYISGLFGQTDGSRLSTEQKETVRAIAGLFGTAAGAALGNTPADVAQGSLNARNSVENNWLSIEEIQEFQQQYKRLPEDEQEREAALEKLFEETAQKSQANRENTAQNCQNPNSAACLNDKEKMTAGWNYVMDANRYLGYEKSIQSNQATEQSSQHKQDNPPASGGTELVNVLVMGKRPPYQERKDVRFFEYENLRDIADFAADDEQRQAIDEYLGSKNYQYTNQPWYAKPYMRMYALPALQATMGVGQAAAGFKTCVMTAGIGCIAGGVLVANGADDAQNGARNFGVEPAKQVPTLRVQGLQAIGLGRGAAESMAAIVDIAAGGVGLLKHPANIGKTAETAGQAAENAAQAARQTGLAANAAHNLKHTQQVIEDIITGSNGGKAIYTQHMDELGRPIYQRMTADGRRYSSYLVLDDAGKPITVKSPYAHQHIQAARQVHETAVEATGGFFRNQQLGVHTNVTINSPGAAQRSVLDQVLAGNPGQSVPVPPGYQAIDLRTNQIVSEIVLDGKGFAGMEMKTGDAALARSQEANYRAAIEGNASSFGAKAADAGLDGATPRNIYLIRPNP